MGRQELLRCFPDNYYPRQEIVYRLPASYPIADFWPEELAYRKDRATYLPLRTAANESFWYVPTDRFLQSGDALARAARYESTNRLPEYSHDDSVIDEAFYSSAIEGAYSTRARARELIQSGKSPENKDERMIVNNYDALRFALDHLDVPIGEGGRFSVLRKRTRRRGQRMRRHSM